MNRLIGIALVCLMHMSQAAASMYDLRVEVTPGGSGSLNTSGGTYEEGIKVNLRTYGNKGYVFKGWFEGETLLSSSTNFSYTMPSNDALVKARYEYDPAVPGNPAMPDTTTYYTLTATVSPVGAGTLNIYNGRYTAGSSVNMRTYGNTGYQFLGWQNGEGGTISTTSSFNYTMPRSDTQLTALYVYDPSVPANPDSMSTRYTVTIACKPLGGGTFNTTNATAEEGGDIHLYAYTNTGYKFLHWESETGEVVSTAQNFDFIMPHGNSKIYGIFEYDPDVPSNPNKNYWNKELGEVIVDDFTPGKMVSAVSTAIIGSNRSDVAMITVAGRMNDNDFGIANDYTNCTLLDLSRVTGVTQVPSYAFDYTNVESVYLPASIEKIGYRAFYECKQLSSLIVYAMIPPILENNVFTNVPEELVVYVPAAAILQYQDADVWKDFTLLPIQEDIRSITISLPEGTNAADYAQMWLELINTKNGQRMHYVMTDRTQYTFANIIRNTSWNVTLRNERGDVFGQIDNVELKDYDVSVVFPSLSKSQSVVLSVLTPDGEDVTAQTQVIWTDSQGKYLAQGVSLSGLPTGYQANYRIALSQGLAMSYNTPQPVDYVLTDGDNRITCQLNAIPQVRISGKVKDASTGLPLSGAYISASQTFGGKYSKTLNAKTDGNGLFTLDVANVPTSVAFAASDYVSQTFICDSLLTGVGEVTLPGVSLRTITGATITLDFTYTSCDGETQNWYSDYHNVSYELFNVTKNKAVSQFNVQYPQIVFLEEVADGDVLRLTATSRTNAFMPVAATATIADQKAEATFAVVELGKIQSSFTSTGNAAVVGSLYDATGKLLKTYNYSKASLTISDLSDGNYTLVSMGSSRLFNTIYDLSQLPQTGLAEGTDYVQNSVEVKSGQVSAISISEVPTLDESKLYYTGDNTSFTVNKPSIVAGNYLTLTGRIDFKPAYATSVSNVQMIVDLPESCEFVENSVMVGNSTSSYTLNGHQITIPMARYTDRVRFCIIPTLGGEYAPSAFVQFDLGGETVTQPIGSANYTAKDLSISVPSTVAKTAIPVSGTAIGTSNVEIYDNDVLIGQTTSTANGTWVTTCELNEPYNLSRHQIHAKIKTKSGLELWSENAQCQYDMNAIEVKMVSMSFYNGWLKKNIDVVFDFEKNVTSASSYMFYTGTDITFTANLTNNDTTVVSGVKIYVYTDKNEIRELTAQYDGKTDRWIAVSRFESNNLPINVATDIIAKKQICLDTNELESILNQFKQVTCDISDFSSLNKSLDYNEISPNDLIGLLSKYDEELSVDSLGVQDDFLNNLSDEELDELIAKLKEEKELIDCDTTDVFIDIYSDLFLNEDYFEKKYDDGTFISVSPCGAMTIENLHADGFKGYLTINGDSVYYLSGVDGHNEIVDLSSNRHLVIIHSTTSLAQGRTSFEEGLDRFNEFIEQLNDVNSKISDAYYKADKAFGGFCNWFLAQWRMTDNIVLNRRNDYNTQKALVEKLNRELKGLNSLNINYIVKEDELRIAEKAAKEANSALKSAIAQRTLAKAAYKLTVPLKGLWSKAFPLSKYLGGIYDAISSIRKFQKEYRLVPRPCKLDEAGAERVRTHCVEEAVAFVAVAGAKTWAQITLDLATVEQICASPATGGTSAISALGTFLLNIAGSCILDWAYGSMVDYGLKLIREERKSLICNPEPDPEPDPDPIPEPPLPPVPPIRDPSGYVYEGVTSNRIEGVTATAYYKENVEDMYGDLHENIVKWDAEEYAQENPLFTDENGYYRWDVPQGLWQVKFEKEGYETTYSEWLPVPPPQLDVNIAMKQNRQPEVKAARAYEDAVEVEFDKYMMPELLTAENIMVMQNGIAVEGTVELLNEEVSYEGEAETFASKIRYNAAQPFTEHEVTLMVNNRVKSYAGIRMQDTYSQALDIEKEVKSIVADSVMEVPYDGQKLVTLYVQPADAATGKILHAESASDMIVSIVNKDVVVDENGMAQFTINGELPGSTAITYTMAGTSLMALTTASVSNFTNVQVALPTSSLISGTSVYKGTTVQLSAGSGLKIWYTTDNTCPCDENGSRILYETPISINSDIIIKAMAENADGETSDVATFTYSILESNAGISLNHGWTWISFNMKTDDLANINTALASGTWTSSDEIKDDRYTDSYSAIQNKWIGTLSKHGKLTNSGMFKIHSSMTQNISLTGEAVNPSETIITVTPNWNYIGYTPLVTMSVAEAMANYDAQDGDVLKSQDAFATYSDAYGWEGDLATMEAGKGYMLKRNPSASQTIFTYPITNSGTRSYSAPSRGYTYKYANNMNVAGMVSGIIVQEGDSILAYSQGEYRGGNRILSDGHIYLTLMGDVATDISLVLLRDGQIISTSSSVIEYHSNEVIGSAMYPTEILFEEYNDEIGTIKSIYSINGMNCGTQNISKLPSGIYLIYSTLNNKTKVTKYIKR